MPTYRYMARDHDGNPETGITSARDIEELRNILRYKQLYLIKYEEHKNEKGVRGFLNLFGRHTRD